MDYPTKGAEKLVVKEGEGEILLQEACMQGMLHCVLQQWLLS